MAFIDFNNIPGFNETLSQGIDKAFPRTGTQVPQDNGVPLTLQGGSFSSFSGTDYKFLFYIPIRHPLETIKNILKLIDEQIVNLQKYRMPGEKVLPKGGDKIPAQIFGFSNDLIQQGRPAEAPSLPINETYKYTLWRLYALKNVLRQYVNNQVPIELKTIQTFSYQIHTDTQPVRSLGFRYPRGYTKGQRLVAGSMIATVGSEHPMWQLMDAYTTIYRLLDFFLEKHKSGVSFSEFIVQNLDSTTSLADELPSMNVVISAVNELGERALATIYGVKFINDGGVMSIQDLMTENTFTWVAQDIDLLRNTRRGPYNTQGNLVLRQATTLTHSDIANARRTFRRNYGYIK